MEQNFDFDFMYEANFEQFIDKFCPNCYCEQLTAGCSLNGSQFDPSYSVLDNSLPRDESRRREEEDDDEESSGTNTMASRKRKKKTDDNNDRTRTLISERKRRGSMKQKLHALRSLVPKITKMDKASIVGDAVLYVQELQEKAKKLEAEIIELESSSPITRVNRICSLDGSVTEAANNIPSIYHNTIHKKIAQMDVFQVEEREFYVRIVSKNGQGVAVSLCKALESLNSFNVQSSNLATSADNFVFTFTLNVIVGSDHQIMEIMNLPNLKLWIAGAFLNQGFDFL